MDDSYFCADTITKDYVPFGDGRPALFHQPGLPFTGGQPCVLQPPGFPFRGVRPNLFQPPNLPFFRGGPPGLLPQRGFPVRMEQPVWAYKQGQGGFPRHPFDSHSYNQRGGDSHGQASADKTYSSFSSTVGGRKPQARDHADRKHQRGYSKSSDKQRGSSTYASWKSSRDSHPRDSRNSSRGGHPRDDRKSSRDSHPRDDRKSYRGRHPHDDRDSSRGSYPRDDRKSSCGGHPRDDWDSSHDSHPRDDRKSYRGRHPHGDRDSSCGSYPRDDQKSSRVSHPRDDQKSSRVSHPRDDQKSFRVSHPRDDQKSSRVSHPRDDRKSSRVSHPRDDVKSCGRLPHGDRDSSHDSHSCNGDGQKSTEQKKDDQEAGKLAKQNMDALLQDDELKHILFAFAGISEATVELEPSLKTTDEKFENYMTTDDSTSRHKSQQSVQTSSAEGPQNPETVLKHKTEEERVDVGSKVGTESQVSSDSFSKLSALWKSSFKPVGALSQLESCNDNDSGDDNDHKDSDGQAIVDSTYSSSNSKVDDRKSPATDDADRKQEKGYSGSSDKQRSSTSPDNRKNSTYGHLPENLASSHDSYLHDDPTSFCDSHSQDREPMSILKKTTGEERVGAESKTISVPAAKGKSKDSEFPDIWGQLYEHCSQRINNPSKVWQATSKEPDVSKLDHLFQDLEQSHNLASSSKTKNAGDNDEELDSAVQNILQSIGFITAPPMRMQELACQRKHQDAAYTGMNKQSASFLWHSEQFAEDVGEASFSDSDQQKKAKFDSLINEVRARMQKRSGCGRSASPDVLSAEAHNSQAESGTDVSPESYGSRMGLGSHEIRTERPLKGSDKNEMCEMGSSKIIEQLRRISYVRHAERWQQSFSRESDVASPPRSQVLLDEAWKSKNMPRGSHEKSVTLSERVRDEPKGFNSDDWKSTKAAALFTSMLCSEWEKVFSSGFKSWKLPLQSGSAHVENQTSRTVHSDDDEPYFESRKVILPSKSDLRIVSQSPAFRKSQSPEMKVHRKRPASPPLFPVSKERRVFSGKGSHSDLQSHQMRLLEKNAPEICQALGLDVDSFFKSPLSQTLLGGLNVGGQPTVERAQSPVTRDHFNMYCVRKSPDRQTLRSPDRHKSGSPGRCLSRSPGRRKSGSLDRQMSVSPLGRHSWSPYRRKSKSSDRQKSISPSRSTSGSPGRHRSRSVKRHESRSACLKGNRYPHRTRSRSRSRRRSKSSGQSTSRSPSQSRSRSSRSRSRSSQSRSRSCQSRSRSPYGQPSRARSPERYGFHHFLIQGNLSTSLKLHIDNAIVRY